MQALNDKVDAVHHYDTKRLYLHVNESKYRIVCDTLFGLFDLLKARPSSCQGEPEYHHGQIHS